MAIKLNKVLMRNRDEQIVKNANDISALNDNVRTVEEKVDKLDLDTVIERLDAVEQTANGAEETANNAINSVSTLSDELDTAIERLDDVEETANEAKETANNAIGAVTNLINGSKVIHCTNITASCVDKDYNLVLVSLSDVKNNYTFQTLCSDSNRFTLSIRGNTFDPDSPKGYIITNATFNYDETRQTCSILIEYIYNNNIYTQTVSDMDITSFIDVITPLYE